MSLTHLASELATHDATGQAELIRRGEVTASEMVEAAIASIEELNPIVNAVVTPMFEQAVTQAKAGPTGPFGGVPYLVKDLILEIAGVRFTEGSKFLRDNVSRFDSELVVRLRRAGLVIVGKTSTPEFGMAPTCEATLFGPTRNPWNTKHSTSGSSGGSAAAVASHIVPMAHASDLGGSIRYPASACGVFGLKPTRQRNPLGPEYGDVVGGWGVEHAVTRSVRDSAALLDATSGPAMGDPYFAPRLARPLAQEVGVDPERLRIGFSARTAAGGVGHRDCVAGLDETVALCESLGHDLVEVDLPGLTPEVGGAIGTIFNAATAWILAYWTRRLRREPAENELDPLTRAYWEAGKRVSAADYLLAVEDLQAFSRTVAGFLKEVNVWLTPTLATPPLPLGEIVSTADEPLRALERGGPTVAYAAVVANITGNPAMSVPLCQNGAGLPIGMHFLGRFGDEATLIRLASQLERAAPWAERVPSISVGEWARSS